MAGERHYRAWVGPPKRYDIAGAQQFSLLTNCLGLREGHTVLDIGCGSLRLGRFLIVYLRAGHYFGVEPEEWLVKDGLQENLGQDLVEKKKPRIIHNAEFDFDFDGQKFNYIIAQSVFSHASLPQVGACMDSAKEALVEPDGIFVFNVGYGKKDYLGKEWAYPKCVKYRRSTIEAEVERRGMVYRHIIVPLSSKAEWTIVAFNQKAIDKKVGWMSKVVT